MNSISTKSLEEASELLLAAKSSTRLKEFDKFTSRAMAKVAEARDHFEQEVAHPREPGVNV